MLDLSGISGESRMYGFIKEYRQDIGNIALKKSSGKGTMTATRFMH